MDKKKWIYIALLLLIIYFLYQVRIVLPSFLFAIIISYAAYPLVMLFERRDVPRWIAIILVYLIFGVISGLIISFLVPQLAKEVDELMKILPKQTDFIEDRLDVINDLQNITLPQVIRSGIDLLIVRFQQILEGLASKIANFFVGMIHQIISLVIAPFLAYYILRDLERLKRRFFIQIPKPYRLNIYSLTKKINDMLNNFIRGQLLNLLIVGLLIAIGLWIVGIKYSLFIGLIAGILNIIPYFGPVIGFIPAFILAMIKSPMTVLWVLVVFVIVNQIETSVIAPKIIGDSVGLHPLAVIFAVLAGGELMGILGMLVAVPIAGIIQILFKHTLETLKNS